MTSFQTLLQDSQPLLLPGVFDALSARIAECAGARAACISGAAVAMAQHARPDQGLQNFGEYHVSIGRIAERSRIPLLVDAEDGFGDVRHVARTVTALERLQVSGLILEDLHPFRPGQPATVVPLDEMTAKLETALRTRSRDTTFLVGRSDAAHVEGLDEALDRAKCYESVGVDAILLTGLRDLDDMRRLRDHVDLPLIAVAAPGKPWAYPSLDDVRQLGYSMLVLPFALLQPTVCAIDSACHALGGSAPLPVDTERFLSTLSRAYSPIT